MLTYPDLSNRPPRSPTRSSRSWQTATRQGDTRVTSLYYDNTALGLDLLGCDWHPSLHDDQIIAGTITNFIATLPLTW